MRFRASLQDQRRASLAAQQAMAHDGMSDAAKRHLAEFEATVKPRQSRAKAGEDGRRLEADVQRDIVKFLLGNPAVAMVERINSGAVYGAENQFIRFHHLMIPKHCKQGAMRVPDLNIMLIDGKRMAIECKREGWRFNANDDRECEQDNYLRHLRRYGALGIFATSVDDVATALTAAGY